MTGGADRPVGLVTGASSGIGAAFARALARDGHDLVLVARDRLRLDALAEELRSRDSAASEVLAADLTVESELAAVEARLRDGARPVEVLVNDAGFGTAGPFVELPVEEEDAEVRLNVLALMRLAHAALPGMVARGHGGVINVSSIGGYQPVPTNATYGATKAFVNSFSQAVHEELHGTGVRMMVLCPGFTRTGFQARAGLEAAAVPGFLWQEAEEVADSALRAFAQGRALCVPGALNRATTAFTSVLPAGVTRRAAGIVMKRA